MLALCTKILLRNRLSFLLEEVQTGHSQAIKGTPLLVPVPRNVMVNGGHCTAQNYGFENQEPGKRGNEMIQLKV